MIKVPGYTTVGLQGEVRSRLLVDMHDNGSTTSCSLLLSGYRSHQARSRSYTRVARIRTRKQMCAFILLLQINLLVQILSGPSLLMHIQGASIRSSTIKSYSCRLRKMRERRTS